MADEYISVSDAFKLVAEPFSGDKRKLKEFCENVDAAFGLINPDKYDLFYKYVRTRITGEAKAKLLVRQDADDWASVKAILKEHYATRRTLDFYACAMFNARQAKHETVAAWCSRLDQLSSDFRDAAIEGATSSEMCGITKLVSQLGKACFIQGLANERIQTVVRARNPTHITEAAEIGTEEESALLSAKEKVHSVSQYNDRSKDVRCNNCRRFGHRESQCFLTGRSKEVKVAAPAEKVCNFCNMPGHVAYTCWKKKKRHGNFSGNENRRARERADGKFAIVAGNKRNVFAKTNSCREFPDADNLTDLGSDMYVNLAKPRPRSAVGCDPPCRRSTEGREEELVLGAMSGSYADQNVSRLDEKKRKFVEVSNSASTESACGKTSASNGVFNSEGEDLQVKTTSREMRVNSDSERVCATGCETEENHDGSILITVAGIDQPLRMLVDTGAQISVIKRGLIPDDVPIHTDKQYEIAGITVGSINTLGSVNLTLHDRTYKFQVAPEEIQLTEDGLIGRDILKDSVINNREGYVDINGHRYNFCRRNDEPIILKPRTETIAAVTVDLDTGLGIVDKQEIYPGVYVASSLSQVNRNKAIVSILNSTEEAMEIRDLTLTATKWSEQISVRKINSQIHDNNESVLSRKKRVRELIRTDHMAESNKKSILEICEDFHDIFYLEGDKLSHTDLIKHSIPTPALDENRAINVRPYRLPEAHKEEVNRQINKLLDDGIIAPSRSAFNSPLLLVPKKADASGKVKWRVVIDFRKLNEWTVGDAYPLPNITDILDQLGKAKYFSTVDLASGPDPRKTEAVRNFPEPKTVKELKGFLGLSSYYRRFIHNYSRVAKPLYELLKKDAVYDWKEPQQNAFQTLKELLVTAPILQYPDFSRPFIITADASGDAAGCVLSQGEIGKDLPIAYASRTFNKSERNYSTTDREMAAIIWAVKQFRPYVLGRHFNIVTDHKPLKWVFHVKDPSSRLLRWRIKLEEYDFTIHYRSGKTISHADFLSRIHKADASEGGDKEAESRGQKLAGSATNEKNETVGSEYSGNFSEPSDSEKESIIREYHESLIGGHTGISRTYERLKPYVSWPNMRRDIENYVRKCASCQRNKHTVPYTKMAMEVTDTPYAPFEKISLDCMGPLPLTEQGNKYILTCQDQLSKYLVAIALPNQEAVTIARALVDNVITVFGSPGSILTDCASNFTGEVMRHLCKLLRISRVNTTPFRPQSNGSVERSHAVITEYLRHFICHEQNDWDTLLPTAAFVYNTTPHTSTKYCPFELVFGGKPSMPGLLQRRPSCSSYDEREDFVSSLKERLQYSHEVARKALLNSKEVSKRYYDQKENTVTFREGDLVLLLQQHVRRGRSKKLSSPWIGPYTVVEVTGVNCVLRSGTKRRTFKVHSNRLKLFI
ncbi:hypothetical protein B7P43_G13934 [Cryptotermes secundus]|uniref:RNA-directed DNA polymerase n=2 Tax=Cryptotermes secundus TaxID=105785 RepID=A0A2J7Q4S7_9NEOP|nr:hypothetical protein B7P43_G04948 [Cryptotermes secundus]PNF24844.1 hypothetical protein B7P43_G13934 [Cryptotermes secundus]